MRRKGMLKPAVTIVLSTLDDCLVQQWTLALLFKCKALDEFIHRLNPRNPDVYTFLGIKLDKPSDPLEWDEDESENESEQENEDEYKNQLEQQLRARYIEIKHECNGHSNEHSQLKFNIERLGESLGLSELENKLLTFTILMQAHPGLKLAAECLGEVSTYKMFGILEILLKEDLDDIAHALDDSSLLIKSGLIELIRDMDGMYLPYKMNVPSGEFAEYMLYSVDADPFKWFKDLFQPFIYNPPNLVEFENLRMETAMLREIISEENLNKNYGINILVHGDIGAGKSTFARFVADTLRIEAYGISYQKHNNYPLDIEGRINAWEKANAVLQRRNTLLVFDDADEVFSRTSNANPITGWIKQALEGNLLPTIWVTNRIEDINPAFISRFAMVVEIKQPSRKQRKNMIEAKLTSMVSAETLEDLCQNQELSPAMTHNAAKVLFSIKENSTHSITLMDRNRLRPQDMDDVARVLFSNALQLQGKQGLDHA